MQESAHFTTAVERLGLTRTKGPLTVPQAYGYVGSVSMDTFVTIQGSVDPTAIHVGIGTSEPKWFSLIAGESMVLFPPATRKQLRTLVNVLARLTY